MSDYETLRMLAVIEWRNNSFGFYCGCIPVELADRKFQTAGEAVHALLKSEAVKEGKIQHFQIQKKDGHISKPYHRVSANKWVKDGDNNAVCVYSLPLYAPASL